MIVDLKKCVGCFNCMLACKDEHVGNKWLPYTEEQEKHGDKWICPTSYERGKAPYTELCFVTRTCFQCDNPACMAKFPDEIYKRDDGIVIIDPKKAKGKKEIVDACPYGAIHWNEKLSLPQKCTGCAHLLDNGWKMPRCVQSCPLRAIETVFCEDDEWERIISSHNLKSLTESDGNRPRVMYKNLYRYNSCFVKGALSFDNDGISEAAIGAQVTLMIGNTVIKKVETDFLGEFYIDGIPQDSGKFRLICKMSGFSDIEQDFEVAKESVIFENLVFEK